VKDIVESVVSEFRRIDVLVNNAGIVLIRPIEDTEKEEFDLVGVNLGVYSCSASMSSP
jgi:NAD(P)-dependent dehydrogenase (short-subunit alcohol dehydrogenase family)